MKHRCTKIEAIDNLSDYLADAIRLLQQDKYSVNLITVRSMSQVKSNKKERCAKTETNANLKDTLAVAIRLPQEYKSSNN